MVLYSCYWVVNDLLMADIIPWKMPNFDTSMKQIRKYLFIIISSIALMIVLLIQVNWIVNTARIKEDLFNEKANMVLARTMDAVLSDKETCMKIGASVEKAGVPASASTLGNKEKHTLDSLLKHYMDFYNFHIDYSFVIVKPEPFSFKKNNLPITIYSEQKGCYQKGLDELSAKNGFELKLIFPQKKQFIIAEMGMLFITSVILIVIVLILFWRTVLSFLREKKLSEHNTDFLNNMTHEFKTPLTNIALAGKMIIKDSIIRQEDKIKYYSGIILEENEKLKQQVEHVLSMSALERDEISFQKMSLNVHDLVHISLKRIGLQLENKQAEVTLSLKAKYDVITGDRTHLTNALCNLIENSIKYSITNPVLHFQSLNTAQNLVIVISDKGVGIEKEYQKKVFDKFFRVPTGDVHDVKGFGIGLAYVKKIIESHAGTIELWSEKGTGTTFTITLPYV